MSQIAEEATKDTLESGSMEGQGAHTIVDMTREDMEKKQCMLVSIFSTQFQHQHAALIPESWNRQKGRIWSIADRLPESGLVDHRCTAFKASISAFRGVRSAFTEIAVSVRQTRSVAVTQPQSLLLITAGHHMGHCHHTF